MKPHSYDHPGKSWSSGMPINLLAEPMLRPILLMKHWTISEALEKDSQTCIYFIKFSLFCAMFTVRDKSYIFKENPLEGGYFYLRPVTPTSRPWCQTEQKVNSSIQSLPLASHKDEQKIKADIHPILNVSGKPIPLLYPLNQRNDGKIRKL